MIAELLIASVTTATCASLWFTDRVMRRQRADDLASNPDPELVARLEKLKQDRVSHERLAHEYRLQGHRNAAAYQDSCAQQVMDECDRLIERGYL